MSEPNRPSFPSAPSDPSMRRLGLGRGATSERPVRAKLVVALVSVLVLLMVPLYLSRHLAVSEREKGHEAASAAASAAAAPSGSALPSFDTRPAEPERVKVGVVQRVRCGTSARRSQAGDACDPLAYFEKALTEAIQSSAECGLRSGKEGTINHVLEIDFESHRLHVFAGASGDWRGAAARRVSTCVERALPKPDWATITHRQRYYALAVMATYSAAPRPSPGASAVVIPGPPPAGPQLIAAPPAGSVTPR